METIGSSLSRRRSNSHNQISEPPTTATSQTLSPVEEPNGTEADEPAAERPSLGAELVNGGPPLQLPQLQEPIKPTVDSATTPTPTAPVIAPAIVPATVEVSTLQLESFTSI